MEDHVYRIIEISGSSQTSIEDAIQSAVSRQREFLADASAVQFTRNPAGLSGALQKLGGYGSRMESPNAPDAAHLFFGNGLADAFLGAFATHPPLADRIHAIDPNWDGKFPRVIADTVEPDVPRPRVPGQGFRRFPLPPIVGLPAAPAANSVIHNEHAETGLNTEIAEISEKTKPFMVFSAISAISALFVRLCVL